MASKRIPQTVRDREIRKSNTEKVDSIVQSFKSYFDATQPLRTAIKKDLDGLVGGRKQWDQAALAQLDQDHRPALSFNILHPTVNFITGVQLQRETDYRYFPRGTEDERLGRIATSLVKYVMDHSQGTHEEAKQFRQGVACGLSVLEVGHSYEQTDDLIEGDCTINTLGHNTWYCDVQARRPDRNDGRYEGKLMWMDPDSINKRWPGHESRMSAMPDWLPYDPLMTGVPEHLLRELWDKDANRVRILQHWYRVPVTVTLMVNRSEPDPTKAVMRMASAKEAEAHIKMIRDQAGASAVAPLQIVQTDQAYGLMNVQTGQAMPVLNEEEGAKAKEMIAAQAGDQEAANWEVLKRETTALRVAHLSGWELLADEPSPHGDDWRFPFSPFICFQDTDAFDDIQGVVRGLLDPQKEINWHHSTIVDTMARAPKGATWVLKGDNADLEKLKKQLPRAGFVGEYATSPPVYWPSQSFNPGDLAMTEVSQDFVMRHSSVNADMVGSTTQKTVSGRAVGARQAGGLVGLSTIFQHWQQTKEYTGTLLLKCVQRNMSVEKMDRIIGQELKIAELAGVDLKVMIPSTQMYDTLKQLKDTDLDVVVGFQEASTTEREAQMTRMMQLMSVGFPVPPQIILEMSDSPYKEELLAAFQKQGMQPPNPDMMKALGAGQGQGANGVNTNS